MEQVTAVLAGLQESPKKIITYTWLGTLFILAVTFIVMCIAGSYMTEGSLEKVVAFSAIWSVTVFILISAAGTIIMRQYQSGLAIGIFSGVVLVMSSQMLIVFALFVDRIQNGHNGNNEPVERAMAVLAFFLFVAYGLFAVLLVVFRKDIVKEHGYTSGDTPTMAGKDSHVDEDEERNEDLPPENI